MDASTATAATSNLFSNIGVDQKLDLAALLRNVAAAAAASSANNTNMMVSSSTPITGSTATSPNSVESSSSTNGNGPVAIISNSPSPPHNNNNNHAAELKPIPASSLAPPGVVQRRQLPFAPIQPVYAPSGHGRQILIYDSRSHPGRRREFAYKTRFTNQSGLTTVYYRCMACRALRHRLQRSLPKEKLPAVPCIAVKNDLLINDPDFPEASDHFCTPLTIDESNQRLRNTFERGHKRARMKMANSTVEETIRKVGKIRAEEVEGGYDCLGEDGDLTDWAKVAADGSSSSAGGMMDLNGTMMEGSDCSSDSIVDVMKEESPDDEECAGDGEQEDYFHAIAQSHHHLDDKGGIKEEEKMETTEKSSPNEALLKQPKLELGSPTMAAVKTPNNFGTTTGTQRSPRKKLDSLLKMAEMRAAAANGNGMVGTQTNDNVKEEVKIPANGQQKVEPQNNKAKGGGTATAIPTSMPAAAQQQLNTLLSSRTNSGGHQQFQHQNVNNPQQQLPTSVQSIHAIAARLSRGGANAASELSKALAGMKGAQQTPPQQHQQQQYHHPAHPQQNQQKCAGFMNGNGGGGGGGEKTIGGGNNNLQQFSLLNNNTGGGGLQPVIGMHIAELFKKYVENNLELAPETAGNARNAGELAGSLFMAQMVENAELRQEVAKLRGELDSLKALVAAAAVVQNNHNNNNNNGIGGQHAKSNGHRH